MIQRSTLLDLYSDFLTSSPNIASSLVMAKVLQDAYSHDAITRMLAQPELSQKDYWKSIKKVVRRVEHDSGIISVDDFIEHKPHSSENDLVCYHYDHSKGRTVKGINIVSFTYVNTELALRVKLPIAFELIRKDQVVTKMVKDKAKRKFVEKTTRQASIGKNELFRTRLKTLTHQNHVRFGYIVFDTWYSSAQNMSFIVQDLKKQFVCAIKTNRLISFDVDKNEAQKHWVTVEQADIEPNRPYQISLKKVPFSVILVKKVYNNLNGTIGVQYLVSSATSLDAETCSTIYKYRWSSEEVHRSLKQNTALEKMPAKLERSQANHIFASMIALTKLECMKMATKTNHYQLKRQVLMDALKQAWLQIQRLKELCLKKSIHFPNFSTA